MVFEDASPVANEQWLITEVADMCIMYLMILFHPHLFCSVVLYEITVFTIWKTLYNISDVQWQYG